MTVPCTFHATAVTSWPWLFTLMRIIGMSILPSFFYQYHRRPKYLPPSNRIWWPCPYHRRPKYLPPSNRIWWPCPYHRRPNLDPNFLLSCVLSGCPYCRHFLYHCHPKYLPPSNRIIIVAQISFTLESYMMTMPLYISCNVSVAPNIFHPFHPQIIYDDHAFMVGFAPLTSLLVDYRSSLLVNI